MDMFSESAREESGDDKPGREREGEEKGSAFVALSNTNPDNRNTVRLNSFR